MNHFAHACARRAQAQMTLFVTSRTGHQRLFWSDVGLAGLTITGMSINFLTEGWTELLAACWVGFYVGRAALHRWWKARAYAYGWIDGREGMTSSFSESARRDMDLEEWLDAEYERNLSVLERL